LLARSIADKPKLLLIKDAFQSIRTEEKKQIVDFLLKKDQPWTLVVVSSDNYVAERVDRIVLLEQGQVVAEGNYKQMKDKLF
jgi:ABC-type bacteriocin/lantibiotic exporter with double-glycine peptidase domain